MLELFDARSRRCARRCGFAIRDDEWFAVLCDFSVLLRIKRPKRRRYSIKLERCVWFLRRQIMQSTSPIYDIFFSALNGNISRITIIMQTWNSADNDRKCAICFRAQYGSNDTFCIYINWSIDDVRNGIVYNAHEYTLSVQHPSHIKYVMWFLVQVISEQRIMEHQLTAVVLYIYIYSSWKYNLFKYREGFVLGGICLW